MFFVSPLLALPSIAFHIVSLAPSSFATLGPDLVFLFLLSLIGFYPVPVLAQVEIGWSGHDGVWARERDARNSQVSTIGIARNQERVRPENRLEMACRRHYACLQKTHRIRTSSYGDS